MPLNTSSLDKNPQHLLRSLAQRVSQAVWLEQESQIIANLAKLANCALASGYVRQKEGAEWPIDHAIIPAVKQLFHIIDRCAAGKIDSYSDLYSLCNQLTHRLLNAKDDQPYYPETINAPVYVVSSAPREYTGSYFRVTPANEQEKTLSLLSEE